jgi:FkbM family methyltransferase
MPVEITRWRDAVSDPELQLLMNLSRWVPAIRGLGRVVVAIRALYRRKRRAAVMAEVLGVRMVLDPHEYVDSALLFFPQFYDPAEFGYLRRVLKPGHTFLDAGCNIGIYSLVASRLVGNMGHVLAIDADPFSVERCALNAKLSGCDNISVLHRGLSDKTETLCLGIVDGNRGSTSFTADDQTNAIMVDCVSLPDLLLQIGRTRVDYAKFDIEGYGIKVLSKFLKSTPAIEWPRGIIAEKGSRIGIALLNTWL